ncbi:hypothetical protein EVAR_40692_1 [Eumeta japonica]|uniref:Uncharacterized protein n=1 Tax=Eumeta variegata TaxID=151549 RepID=A0A4C1XAL5_EUMVA|nr:hypothetical protein EVAR_40692_1 [Eumeta japonica]
MAEQFPRGVGYPSERVRMVRGARSMWRGRRFIMRRGPRSAPTPRFRDPEPRTPHPFMANNCNFAEGCHLSTDRPEFKPFSYLNYNYQNKENSYEHKSHKRIMRIFAIPLDVRRQKRLLPIFSSRDGPGLSVTDGGQLPSRQSTSERPSHAGRPGGERWSSSVYFPDDYCFLRARIAPVRPLQIVGLGPTALHNGLVRVADHPYLIVPFRVRSEWFNLTYDKNSSVNSPVVRIDSCIFPFRGDALNH